MAFAFFICIILFDSTADVLVKHLVVQFKTTGFETMKST